jgi:zona occludens toxin
MGEVHLDCERRRADSSKTVWKYPKNIYSLYKSAEIHTHKIQLPKHVWYLVIALAALVTFVVFIGTRTAERMAPVEASQPVASPVGAESFLSPGMAEKRPMTREEYLQSFMPRIPGLQHTAPRYDAITKPVTAPIIAGCVVMKKRCQCYTQQHSRYPASDALCRDIASGNNPFYDFVSAPGEAAGARTERADAPRAQASAD